MEFKDLRIFLSVSKHGSISRAAKSLNYVQLHVTSRIKSLEAELNTQLFLRHRTATTLISVRTRRQSYEEKIMKTINDINKTINDTEQPSWRLDIGSIKTIT